MISIKEEIIQKLEKNKTNNEININEDLIPIFENNNKVFQENNVKTNKEFKINKKIEVDELVSMLDSKSKSESESETELSNKNENDENNTEDNVNTSNDNGNGLFKRNLYYLFFSTILIFIYKKYKIPILFIYKKFIELFVKYANMDYFLF